MLQSLQKLLAVIYDVPVEHDVADFLLTDRSRLPESARASGAAEQVLVAEDGDTLWVSVYLEPALLQRLAASDPFEALHAGNIADYWTVLEGREPFRLSGLERFIRPPDHLARARATGRGRQVHRQPVAAAVPESGALSGRAALPTLRARSRGRRPRRRPGRALPHGEPVCSAVLPAAGAYFAPGRLGPPPRPRRSPSCGGSTASGASGSSGTSNV